jgi:hypothetical protein
MRGFISLRTLFWLVVLTALGTVGVAYGKTWLLYFRIKGELNDLANQCLIDATSDKLYVDRTIAKIHDRTELAITRSDVVIRRDVAAQTVVAEVHVALPTVFPVVNKTIYQPKIITAQAKRIKSY